MRQTHLVAHQLPQASSWTDLVAIPSLLTASTRGHLTPERQVRVSHPASVG